MVKPKVVFKNVYKEYSMLKSNTDKLLDFFVPEKADRSFYAVKDVSFEVYPGETIGIIGINGSGKSTISNLLAEVIPPTAGRIEIDGETSLIAISVGLNGQLSGLENIHLKCMMHGMTEEEISKVTPKIIEFADIGSFIEQPVKNYSSGMKSRLGFAISVHTNPDVLVVDEALSVGDQTFYEKCMNKINEFKREGKTIFFVSHSASQMKKVSDRVIWMHYGTIREFGEKNQVIEKYTSFIRWFNKLNEEEKKEYKEEMFKQQSLLENDNVRHVKKELTSEEKKNRKLFNFQLSFLSIILMSMMVLIITGTPISKAWSKVSTITEMLPKKEVENDKITESKGPIAQSINKEGYITTKNAVAYEDIELESKEEKINLFTEVYVVEQYEDVLKIITENKTKYINEVSVDTEYKQKVSDLTVEELLPYLSEDFVEAYLYYLSLLGKDIDTVLQKVSYVEASKEEGNWTVLQILGGELEYHADSNDVVVKMEIPLEQEMSEEIVEEFTNHGLKDNQSTVYAINANSYSYVYDTKENTITFILKKDRESN